MSFTDSQKGQLEEMVRKAKSGIRWQPEVNVTTVLGFLMFCGVMYTAASDIQRTNDKQDLRIKQQEVQSSEIKASIDEMQSSIRSLELTVRELQIELKSKGK